MTEEAGEAPPSDLLSGWQMIARYLGRTERSAIHLHQAHGLPVFKIGAIVCARRSSIELWAERKERGE